MTGDIPDVVGRMDTDIYTKMLAGRIEVLFQSTDDTVDEPSDEDHH